MAEEKKYTQELKKCILLHSNDIHADFIGSEKDDNHHRSVELHAEAG